MKEPSTKSARVTARQFLVLVFELAVSLGIVLLYGLELERGFGVVAVIMFAGFLIHCWLPNRIRVLFFLLLTILALAVLLRADAVWVMLLGLTLIGLCHLPIAWSLRVMLITVTAGILATIWTKGGNVGWASAVIPVLAAIFMFRLALYLYDLKDENTPATTPQRLAYFFMLPNVCFPLFPVIDYKTFVNSYYSENAIEIYHKGILWIFRGIAHLLLYRVVYYSLPRIESELTGVLGVFAFMAMTYGLYLRVSGLFHIITGSLCLFGFNLPRTNRNYFLASSFNDLWRRINIYWKDFMVTLVFYPVFMRVRRCPMSLRLIFSTATVFVVTWILHSYQWLWLQGSFPVLATDIAFWSFLGLALAANSVWEAKAARPVGAGSDMAWRTALLISCRTLGVFTVMAFIWGLWYSDSIKEWGYRVLRVQETGPLEWLFFVMAAGGIVLSGAVLSVLNARGWRLGTLEKLGWRRAAAMTATLGTAVFVLGLPSVQANSMAPLDRLVTKMKSTSLNRIDLDRRERGYYETLTRATTFAAADGWAVDEDPEILFRHTQAVRTTEDIRGYEIVPGVKILFRNATFTSNRWGMRDRDYELKKPVGYHRIALLGSSHVMGWGVNDGETFENLVENKLNGESAFTSGPEGAIRVEILNFAVAGYALPQALYVAEEMVPRFEPDVIVYVVHPREGERLIKRLRILITGFKGDVGEQFGYISRTLEEAGAHVGLPAGEFERRLAPYRRELLERSLQRLAATIRSQDAMPLLLILPLTDESFEKREIEEIKEIGRGAGFNLLYLTDVYGGHDPDAIRMTATDNHPNAFGHRLIAERLTSELRKHADALGLGD